MPGLVPGIHVLSVVRSKDVAGRDKSCWMTHLAVMLGLVPGIHVFLSEQDVDGRDEPGHDVEPLPGLVPGMT